jgi:hypothetical protein
MGKRFSKGALADQLRQRSVAIQAARTFDCNNGTAQLCPRGCDAATQALIDRAVDYGRWYTLWNLAQDVEDNCIGVA